jgi:hypothetical protein
MCDAVDRAEQSWPRPRAYQSGVRHRGACSSRVTRLRAGAPRHRHDWPRPTESSYLGRGQPALRCPSRRRVAEVAATHQRRGITTRSEAAISSRTAAISRAGPSSFSNAARRSGVSCPSSTLTATAPGDALLSIGMWAVRYSVAEGLGDGLGPHPRANPTASTPSVAALIARFILSPPSRRRSSGWRLSRRGAQRPSYSALARNTREGAHRDGARRVEAIVLHHHDRARLACVVSTAGSGPDLPPLHPSIPLEIASMNVWSLAACELDATSCDWRAPLRRRTSEIAYPAPRSGSAVGPGRAVPRHGHRLRAAGGSILRLCHGSSADHGDARPPWRALSARAFRGAAVSAQHRGHARVWWTAPLAADTPGVLRTRRSQHTSVERHAVGQPVAELADVPRSDAHLGDVGTRSWGRRSSPAVFACIADVYTQEDRTVRRRVSAGATAWPFEFPPTSPRRVRSPRGPSWRFRAPLDPPLRADPYSRMTRGGARRRVSPSPALRRPRG